MLRIHMIPWRTVLTSSIIKQTLVSQSHFRNNALFFLNRWPESASVYPGTRKVIGNDRHRCFHQSRITLKNQKRLCWRYKSKRIETLLTLYMCTCKWWAAKEKLSLKIFLMNRKQLANVSYRLWTLIWFLE